MQSLTCSQARTGKGMFQTGETICQKPHKEDKLTVAFWRGIKVPLGGRRKKEIGRGGLYQ